ncbi:hypothetical protein [Bacillus sp. FJAT-44742]|uniref:hypothetical protein n=1 Tax=Bacillus sp. FJAT-44742 TaxID=2014005 RepID=UPI0018E216CB|nr:hypothetical protein [Bacillus sp. FJAT-44742]
MSDFLTWKFINSHFSYGVLYPLYLMIHFETFKMESNEAVGGGFASPSSHTTVYTDLVYGGYAFHAFSYKKLPCLEVLLFAGLLL